jgi:hypothetical protein
MSKPAFRLVEPVAGFDEGDMLDVTTRFGDWHTADVRLEPIDDSKSGSVELTFHELENVSRARPRPAV